ncbi:DUF5671 domain-containing protein [Paracoccus sp. TK19116]|uniref:DUF5671 domain-containing protein n=1 Tax=Paracoccus albicereus TaxID=2922394 RepID=A0ABT1MWW7_9RHOB|nr:DUF5671 domain-containing protein [Paracoccus albicereus]MCQ0971823.1 DUF5671 domain-containing protein [Paracoccus albicereus]
MKSGDVLGEFVRQALAEGRDRADVTAALTDAGWSAREIEGALDRWAVSPGLPPVPRPSAYVSAREALLYGLLFIALANVVIYTVMLGFGIINRLLPDPTEIYYSGQGVLRWPIAALIAFLPLFLYLNHRANRRGDDQAARQRSLVRRWIASLVTLIAILALVCDLVTVLYVFLNGDLSSRFIAKVALVAIEGALVLAYCREELDG